MQYPGETGMRWADSRILVVDDDAANARLMSRLLARAGYHDVHAETDDRQALDAFRTLRPDLVILDLRMPHVDGFALIQRIRELSAVHTITPVLVITADPSPESRRRAHLLGANDYLVKPYDLEEVILRVDALLELRAHAQAGFRAVYEIRDTLDGALASKPLSEREVVRRLAIACSFRDSMSEGHTWRVGDLAGRLAAQLQLDPVEVDAIRACAPLHDIGKVAIPDEILLKPARLTDHEMSVAERHTTIGSLMLAGSDLPLLRLAAEIAIAHHERWDGTGYPKGLSGDAIPLAGRIVAVADVFDALTHERPYKAAWPVHEALSEIAAGAGTQFDPDVVAALLSIMAPAAAA